ncbi:hypothetical protein K7X08_030911 [Anisodus acutangulus]|uniref:Uncharacterized protein n=1 Tax=Anisodus acutangulus TaxID=402998 RepID=A0A9Q1M3Q8_9SOLA|nr:hypothetical protein K7X08_030911 [Anisodus acutangulus]
MTEVETVVEEIVDEGPSVEKNIVSAIIPTETRDEEKNAVEVKNDVEKVAKTDVEKNEVERNIVETNNVSVAILVESVKDGYCEKETASAIIVGNQSGEKLIKEDDADNEQEKYKETYNDVSEECSKDADVIVCTYPSKEHAEMDGEPVEDLMLVQKENISTMIVQRKSFTNKELYALVSHYFNILHSTSESLSTKEHLLSSGLDKGEEVDILQKTNEVTKQTNITPK